MESGCPKDQDSCEPCDCEKEYKASQLKFSGVPDQAYLDQLREKAWTYEIHYDPKHQIGPPPDYLSSLNELFVYSPFVLSIGFLGSCGEDETACIDGLMAYTSPTFAALHVPFAASGILLTRNNSSLQIRMACMPSCCHSCGSCKHCLSQIPTVNSFVQSLGSIALTVYIRQRRNFYQAKNSIKVPYPTTNPSAFVELLTRLLRGFHKGGIHDRNAAAFQSESLIASTYESTPAIGCVFSVGMRSILPVHALEPPKSGPQCGICLEVVGNVALIQIPCRCFRCIECLGQSFQQALSARHNFPPMCCGEVINVQKFGSFLQPDLVSRFMAVADEFTATSQLYCGDPKCSEFIRDALVADDVGMCPKCLAQTCAKCGKLESNHLYEPFRKCPSDENKTKLEILANEQNWKACPSCQALVERTDGCNHIKCHCGHMFCYQCGIAYEREPNCECGLGLHYLREQESDEDEPDEAEEEGEDESDEDEDEEDAARREMLLEVGLELRRGDLGRIRVMEIQLLQAAQARRVQQQVERQREAPRADDEHNGNGNEEQTDETPLRTRPAVASRRAPSPTRVVGAPPVW